MYILGKTLATESDMLCGVISSFKRPPANFNQTNHYECDRFWTNLTRNDRYLKDQARPYPLCEVIYKKNFKTPKHENNLAYNFSPRPRLTHNSGKHLKKKNKLPAFGILNVKCTLFLRFWIWIVPVPATMVQVELPPPQKHCPFLKDSLQAIS